MIAPNKIQFLDKRGDAYYACNSCNTHLALDQDLLSASFHGRTGRAYFFNKVFNVTIAETEDRELMTGRHCVADISCLKCHTLIGWKYIRAFLSTQKYKEKKYIIEKVFFCKYNNFPSTSPLRTTV